MRNIVLKRATKTWDSDWTKNIIDLQETIITIKHGSVMSIFMDGYFEYVVI